MSCPNHLHLQGLVVTSHIGVPEEERAVAQSLRLNITLWPSVPLTGLQDDFSRTVDYAAVAGRLRVIAAERPRRLIETLAEDLLTALLAEFPLREVRVEIEKFILPHTDFVRVCLSQSRPCPTDP